ncbi:hypothetical protein GCM10023094_20830 [Rhodococcus olei]|uniref:Anti-sigma-D factor RsdA sigma factor binding region domain-containing protein n=1 Tax=Rhodococcus olei TaxID=2161675 RepID=A0ABP8P1J3_9NOCA
MARGSKRSGHDKWSRRHDASDADLTQPEQGDASGAAGGESGPGESVDLAAVQRDDALIDAIAGGGDVPTASAEEYQLAALLAGWRADIVGPDLPAGPTLDEVAAAVDEELARQASPRRGGLRLVRPLAGAAAAIAVVMAGLTVFSYNAQPGDPLWRVKEVVFTERANSTVASIDTTSNLQEAERLIQSGDTQAAMTVLQSASKRVGAVNDADKRDELNAWHDRLMADVEKATTTTVPPSTTTPPGATTTVPVPPPTTLPGGVLPTVPTVPSELPSLPVVPTLPSLTLPSLPPPVEATTPSPGPVVTTTESPKPEPPSSTGTGSTSTPVIVVPTPKLPSADLLPNLPGTPTG